MSSGREGIPNQVENDYRTYLNTNLSENSCLTVETSRAISSEISSQMSKKLEEKQANLNSQILDIINSAIEDKVLPSIKIAVKSQNSTKMHIWTFGQTDCIRAIQVRHMLRRTYSQMDRIQ